MTAPVTRGGAPFIRVDRLVETYRISERDPGFMGTLRGVLPRRHRTVQALAGVTFELQRGELLDLIGQYPLATYARWYRRVLTFVVPLGCVAYYPALRILGRLGLTDRRLRVSVHRAASVAPGAAALRIDRKLKVRAGAGRGLRGVAAVPSACQDRLRGRTADRAPLGDQRASAPAVAFNLNVPTTPLSRCA